MGRGVHCTAPERHIIKQLSDEGKSMTKIADLMNCSKKKCSPLFITSIKRRTEIESETTKRFDDILARTIKKDIFLRGNIMLSSPMPCSIAM